MGQLSDVRTVARSISLKNNSHLSYWHHVKLSPCISLPSSYLLYFLIIGRCNSAPLLYEYLYGNYINFNCCGAFVKCKNSLMISVPRKKKINALSYGTLSNRPHAFSSILLIFFISSSMRVDPQWVRAEFVLPVLKMVDHG